MKKRIFIIHGWAGRPDKDWMPWLRKELKSKGFEVIVPLMPETENPKVEKWVPALMNLIKNPDVDTYLVGHSMGCQAIARYLESLPENVEIGGVVFVAGFFKRLKGLNKEEQLVADPWLSSPLDLQKVKPHVRKSIAIFSDDDPFVTLDNVDDFKNILRSKIVIEHGQRHFNMQKLSTILNSVLEIT